MVQWAEEVTSVLASGPGCKLPVASGRNAALAMAEGKDRTKRAMLPVGRAVWSSQPMRAAYLLDPVLGAQNEVDVALDVKTGFGGVMR